MLAYHCSLPLADFFVFISIQIAAEILFTLIFPLRWVESWGYVASYGIHYGISYQRIDSIFEMEVRFSKYVFLPQIFEFLYVGLSALVDTFDLVNFKNKMNILDLILLQAINIEYL